MIKRLANESELQLLSKYGLTPSAIKSAALFKYTPGEFILSEGDVLDYFYFILSGKAKVTLSIPNGKQLLLTYIFSDSMIGDIELMTTSKESLATIQATSDLTCIGIPLGSNSELFKTNLSFLNYLSKELARKLRKRNINSTITTLHPVEERLCAYILQNIVNGIFNENLTDVSNLLGTSYRHLLRCLDKLCQNGILKKEKKGFSILNEASLKSLASDLYIL